MSYKPKSAGEAAQYAYFSGKNGDWTIYWQNAAQAAIDFHVEHSPSGTDWIENAMTHGGSLLMDRDAYGDYMVVMCWGQNEGSNTIEATGPTIAGALTALNDALREDAAEELRKDGKV